MDVMAKFVRKILTEMIHFLRADEVSTSPQNLAAISKESPLKSMISEGFWPE